LQGELENAYRVLDRKSQKPALGQLEGNAAIIKKVCSLKHEKLGSELSNN